MYVSCGTYQYSGYINDGIYENSDDVYAENEEDKPNKKYYDPRKWIREGELTFKELSITFICLSSNSAPFV